MFTDQCLILAGGYGSRLGEITKKIPKPLIKVNGKPFIYYLIKNLYRQGIREFIILTYYKNSLFKKKELKYFKDIKIKVLKEKKKSGTLGSIINAKKFLKKTFFVVNGDTFFDFNIRDLENNVLKFKKYIGIALTKIKSSDSKISYELKFNKFKNVFISKRKIKYVCGGLYFLKKQIINKFKLEELDIDRNLILKSKKKIFAKYYRNNFLDIGTPEDLKKSGSFIKKNIIKPCVFLDRDGVFNYDYGYVHKPARTKWRKNIFNTVKFLNDNNYRVIIVTNQAGIAKGLYTIKTFKKYTRWFHNEFLKTGSFIDQTYYCPYHPHGKIKIFKKKSNQRKPGNGMILDALRNWEIDKKNSFLIGDKLSDLKAGEKSGIRSYFVKKDIYLQVKRLIK